MQLKQITDELWRLRKSFQDSFVPQKIKIAELEAENRLYRERSERAEEWLRRIYSEIQDNLIRKP